MYVTNLKGKEISIYHYKNFIRSMLFAFTGILFIIFKNNIISIALTLYGIYLIFYGVFFIKVNFKGMGIFNTVLGLLITALGWALVDKAIYVIAFLFLLLGLNEMFASFNRLNTAKNSNEKVHKLWFCLGLISRILYVITSIFFFININGNSIWTFNVIGILLILVGVISILFRINNIILKRKKRY